MEKILLGGGCVLVFIFYIECRYSAAPCQEAAEKETEDVQKAHKWLRDKFEEALGNIDF